MWQCKNCHEEIDEHLTYCWRCATERFDPEPAPQPAAKAEPEPVPQPAAKAEPEPVPQPAAKAEPEPAPQPAAKAEPEPAPQPEAKDKPELMTLEISDSWKEPIINCFEDAYIIAHRTISLGKTIKVLAYIIGGVIILIGIEAAIDHGYMAVAGNVLGILIAVVIHKLGRSVSAQGRILKAKLDTAVKTSPFLTHEEIRAILFSEKAQEIT